MAKNRTGAEFRVLVGLTWDDDRRRAEPGDVVADLPPGVIATFLREGLIERADTAPGDDEQPERVDVGKPPPEAES